MRIWATWSHEMCPRPWQDRWNRMSLMSIPAQVILWWQDSLWLYSLPFKVFCTRTYLTWTVSKLQMSLKFFLRTISQAKPETTSRKYICTEEETPSVCRLKKASWRRKLPWINRSKLQHNKIKIRVIRANKHMLIELLTLLQLRVFSLKHWS